MTISIQKIDKTGLQKEEWNFTPYGTNLTYTSHYVYHRNNKREKWADEKPKCLIYSDWCKKNKVVEWDDWSINKYKIYLDENNPVLQKTKKGLPKLSGISAPINEMPKCPHNIATKAALEFCLQLKVIYE